MPMAVVNVTVESAGFGVCRKVEPKIWPIQIQKSLLMAGFNQSNVENICTVLEGLNEHFQY
jgi:hypothetical protein